MLRASFDFALKNRGWFLRSRGAHCVGRRLFPQPAHRGLPTVANNYVQIITQWPGRSAEKLNAR